MQQEVAYDTDMLRPAQIRAARALIGWDQTRLAKETGLSIATIKDIERQARAARQATLMAIELAFNRAGLIFLEAGDDGGIGVRLVGKE